VLRYNGGTGAFIDVFASSGGGVTIAVPFHLRFGPDGNLYVTAFSGHNVARFDGQTGAPIDNFVPPGSGGLVNAAGLRFGPDANLYVADWGTDSVMRYDGQTGDPLPGPNGTPGTAEFIPPGSGGVGGPHGLVFFPTPPCEGGGGQDCNHNGIDDTCEISDGTSLDENENGIPDECDCFPSSPPEAVTILDSDELPIVLTTNRFLTFTAGDADRSQAIRVTLVDLPTPFDTWNGATLWVGTPSEVSENGSSVPPIEGFPIFNAATLECTDTPRCMDWSKKLPAGHDLMLQVHYTTNGKRRKDKCKVGVIYSDGPVSHEVRTRGIYNLNFVIPPGESNYEVRASYTLKEDLRIISFYPHMHFRGKDWTFLAHLPDGETKTLLVVPRYDYNWQESYILKKPRLLPKGTRIECIAHYDNSSENFSNPDPTVAVRFGDQSWEEMMIGYFDYVVPVQGTQ